FAWYNYARFHNVLDNGIKYHMMAPRFVYDFNKYGYLSLHYVPRNFYYELLRLPFFHDLFKEPGPIRDKWEGFSLFYQSPFLLYAFASLAVLKQDIKANFSMRAATVIGAWLATITVGLLILCVMGTG